MVNKGQSARWAIKIGSREHAAWQRMSTSEQRQQHNHSYRSREQNGSKDNNKADMGAQRAEQLKQE